MFRDDIIDHAYKYWITPCKSGTVYTKNQVINVKQEVSNRRLTGNWQGLFMPYDDNDFRLHEGLYLVRNVDLDNARENGTEELAFRINAEDKILICTYYDDDKKNNLDPKIKPKYHGLNDCAHFASECLASGGIKCGTGSVGELLRQLSVLPYTTTKTLALTVPLDKAKNFIDSPLMQRGDAIIYSSKKGEHNHSAIYLGDGKRAMHTVSNHAKHPKLKGEWTFPNPDDRHDQFTLIHLSGDDDKHSVGQILLSGWWTANLPTGPAYYYLTEDGIAGRFVRKTEGPPNMFAAAERGYWFLKDRDVFITGTKSGTLLKFPAFPLINPGSKVIGQMDGNITISMSNGDE